MAGNQYDHYVLPFHFIFAVFILIFSTTITAEAVTHGWKQVPLRTQAQKDYDPEMFGGEGMQHITGMSYALSDANVVYLVTDTSQTWKSTDGGYSWQIKNNGFYSGGGIALAVDPNNPDIVFVAGSKVQPAGSSSVDGIYRTQNGGESWANIGQTAYYSLGDKQGGSVFAFDPSSFDGTKSTVIYAGTHEEGLLKSTDGGDTWDSLNILAGTKVLDVKLKPQDPSIIYIAAADGLYRALNNGQGPLEKLGSSVVNQGNLLFNAGFETGDWSYWTPAVKGSGEGMFSIDNTVYKEGSYSAKFDVTAGGAAWWVQLKQDNLSLQQGEDYSLSFWVRGENILGGNRQIVLYDSSGSLTWTRYFDITTDWVKHTLDFSKLLRSSSNAALKFDLGIDTGTVWIDDVQFAHVDMLNNGLPADAGDFPRAIAVHPDNPDVIYVTAGKSGVYKSEDGGQSFNPKNYGLYQTNDDPLRHAKISGYLSVSPADPDYLYVSFYEWSGMSPYYSHDGGDSWSVPLTYDGEGIVDDLNLESNAYYGTMIAAHPENRDIALIKAGGSRPEMTYDGGVNYFYSSNGYSGGAAGWSSSSFGFDPSDPDIMVFFLSDFGPYITEDGSSTFKGIKPPGTYDGFPGAIDLVPGDEVIVTAARPEGEPKQVLHVGRLQSNVWTWMKFNGTYDSEGDYYRFMAFHPQDSNIIYAGSWTSSNRGSSWTQLTESVRAVYAGDGDIVYALQKNGNSTTSLLKSFNQGQNWNDSYDPIPEAFNNIYQSEIAVGPGDSDKVYVAARNALYIWNKIESKWDVRNDTHGLSPDELGQLSIARVTIDPNQPDVIYVGKWAWGYRSNGVFCSTDGGNSFGQISYNFGPRWGSLAVNPWDGYVYLGSPYGTWRMPPPYEDTDGDGILNDEDGKCHDNPCAGGSTENCDDNCIYTMNPDQADFDGDGVGDACDDSDEDGMMDSFELQYGLDPNDAADADDHNDGDGLTNLEEFIRGTDPFNTDTDGDGRNDSEICPLTLPAQTGGAYYSTLGEAYAAASDTGIISSQFVAFTEDLDMYKSVTLDGGYDCKYTGLSGKTTLNGAMTISDGTVVIGNFTLE